MGISDIADSISRSVENVSDTVSSAFLEPVIRLGVTGLARSGKTVFITSLVANLLDRGRMPQLSAQGEGRILAAYLQPQPNDTVPRFEFENHLGALTSPKPYWPESTRTISQLRLSLRVQPNGMLSGLSGPRTVHLDIVDYPGEWLLDLALLEKSYGEWSKEVLRRIQPRQEATAFLKLEAATDTKAQFDEVTAKGLAAEFTDYLQRARDNGYYDCTPGRFLLPGDLAGSPALTFAPLAAPDNPPRRALYREMERRFEAYKSRIVKPFFRDHFAQLDRQVVLVDALGAIHNGPKALGDLRHALVDILGAFRPGSNSFLGRLWRGRRVEKILFAASKADHLHHSQHPQLTAIMEAMVREARAKADFSGASTGAMAIAALRATVEETVAHEGAQLDCVRGILLDTGKPAAFYPGDLPKDPMRLLGPAQEGAEKWLDDQYSVMNFAPSVLDLQAKEGPPHIRLDKAAEFLIGDRL